MVSQNVLLSLLQQLGCDLERAPVQVLARPITAAASSCPSRAVRRARWCRSCANDPISVPQTCRCCHGSGRLRWLSTHRCVPSPLKVTKWLRKLPRQWRRWMTTPPASHDVPPVALRPTCLTICGDLSQLPVLKGTHGAGWQESQLQGHMRPVLEELFKALQARAAAGAPGPETATLRLVIHVVNSMRMACV